MRAMVRSATSMVRLAWLFGRAGATSLYQNWALALFSVVVASGIWFAVQDVENPRTEDIVPYDHSIPIEIVNRPDGVIVDDLPQVKVKVEAREADLPNLRAADFRATVDVKGLSPDQPEPRPVRVESQRDGVKVLAVDPPTVDVRLIKAAQKEVRVEVRQTGDLPVGYRLAEEPVVEPAFVTVSGRPELVGGVETVQLDVNLSGVRSETFDFEGQLVARSAGGNPQTVDFSQARAKATFKIAQVFTQRTLPVLPVVSGSPAPGYRVTAVTWDPPTATVTGPKAVIDSLPNSVTTEAVAISGAKTDVTATKSIDRPQNVSVDRASVVVRVKIEPIDCSSQIAGPCSSTLAIVAPTFEGYPPGLVLQRGETYAVQVRVAGTFAQLALLKSTDVKATVSLVGGTAGTGTFPVRVTLPPGLQLESADATLTVTLVPVLP